jgi:hypothetical protein
MTTTVIIGMSGQGELGTYPDAPVPHTGDVIIDGAAHYIVDMILWTYTGNGVTADVRVTQQQPL